ncbi:MAG: cobalamin-dependent protein [Phycisphaerae bacterium]
MRIALLYPPPWKIPPAGGAPDACDNGPPPEAAGIDMKGDFATAPYGLLSLAAQALRAGHQVKVLNLSTLPWPDVESLIRTLTADVYGLTCFTSNRRGVNLVAQCIRRHHSGAHIVVGGPHVSALPTETLKHCPAIDTVVIGEGEETFLELIGRIEAGQSTEGIPGTAWRAREAVRTGPRRERISDLDSLAPVHDYFPSFTVLTSRGCFGQCTFCASQAMWHRKLRFHSVEYVVDTLERAISRLPLKMIAVKDDTFTANRRRALAVCHAIRDRGLNFLWSCDTRADVLDEELLRAMRLAGCQRISLGVESGSPKVLKNIRKNIDLPKVLEVTRLAKKYGLCIRYYMMAGNRGESARTFQESLTFLDAARPHEYIFTILSVYPGTTEFEVLKRRSCFVRVRAGRSGPEPLTWQGRFSAATFFEHDFMEFSAFPDSRPAEASAILQWLRTHFGIQKLWQPSVADCRAALQRLGDLHAAHLDLGAALAYASQPAEAERHVRRAIELGYPVPSLALNYLACIAGQRGDLNGMKARLEEALQQEYAHPLAASNLQTLTAWLDAGGPKSGRPLELAMRHDFEIIPENRQPVRPGPLPADCRDWPDRQPQAATAAV